MEPNDGPEHVKAGCAEPHSCLKCGGARSDKDIAEDLGFCKPCRELGLLLHMADRLFEASPSDPTESLVVRREINTDRLPPSLASSWKEIESKTLKLLSNSNPYRRFTADDFQGLLRFLEDHVVVPQALRGIWTAQDAVLMLSADEIVALLDTALAQTQTNVATSSAMTTTTAPNAVTQSKPKKKIKHPSKEAIMCYRQFFLTGLTQKAIAEKVYDNGSFQGQVSRYIKTVKQFVTAGGILPDLDSPREKIGTMDPSKIDDGPRLDKGRRYKPEPRD